jgi:hypothetical protein
MNQVPKEPVLKDHHIIAIYYNVIISADIMISIAKQGAIATREFLGDDVLLKINFEEFFLKLIKWMNHN